MEHQQSDTLKEHLRNKSLNYSLQQCN